ncbi:MAG: DUF1643 domain-containing protein [Alphaproteobacteria bacterium]|nr:DUF1643 domain-containing protein [Alphaproteobacteria bacterium]
MHDQIFESTVVSTAIKSECGRYRYVLKRIWNSNGEIGAFLCANPSKADQLLLDDTVFKCGNLAVYWGWGGFYILNLYPIYSTDPKGVERNTETDEHNAYHIAAVVASVKILVLACGNGHRRRLDELIQDIPREKLFCLRRNSGGGFLHPSRIKPEDFTRPVRAFEQLA